MDDKLILGEYNLVEHLEILREAKIEMMLEFDDNAKKLYESLVSSPKFLTVTPEEMISAINLLKIPIDRVDLFW
jgi:hypothetical protein